MTARRKSSKFKASNDLAIRELLSDKNYQVQRDGTILTLVQRTGKVSKKGLWREAGSQHGDGYRFVSYNYTKLAIHRIIYQAFLGELNEYRVVNHKDGNGLNNNISNLELVPVSANNFHRFRDLKHPPVYGNAKITFEIAEEIRKLSAEGFTYTHLRGKFGVAKSTISDIVNRKIRLQPNPQEVTHDTQL